MQNSSTATLRLKKRKHRRRETVAAHGNSCDGRPSFRHFCHLSCGVLFCREQLSWPVFSHLYSILFCDDERNYADWQTSSWSWQQPITWTSSSSSSWQKWSSDQTRERSDWQLSAGWSSSDQTRERSGWRSLGSWQSPFSWQ